MKSNKLFYLLSFVIIALAAFATITGIFSSGGIGPTEFTSVNGQKIILHGEGIYKNMSAEVAPQGIAQDYVTLFLAIPVLLFSLFYLRRNNLFGKLLFTGTIAYFLGTYTFYMLMGMYNHLFLVYVALASISFFTFIKALFSINIINLRKSLENKLPHKFLGGFLIFTTVSIAILWLSIIIPPLLVQELPVELEHYTTLVVQGLDLAFLLPGGFIAGVLLLQKQKSGYLLAPVYIIFLSFLMTALTAKVIAMGLLGFNIFPSIVLIPAFNLLAIFFAIKIFKNNKARLFTRENNSMIKLEKLLDQHYKFIN